MPARSSVGSLVLALAFWLDFAVTVIPGHRGAMNPESRDVQRDSGFADARPGMTR
jgi:hypothetical protein